MTVIRPLRLAALVAATALAAACSDSSTGPSNLQPADLKQALNEMQPSSLAPLNSQISAAPVAELGALEPSTCSYDSSSKSFTCPNVSITGIAVTRSFTLFDASGNPQSQFDRTTTAAVQMKTTFAGTVASGGSTLTIDQIQDVTLSGLLTGVHTLNGTSLGHVAGNVSNGTITTPVATTISTTISNLVLPSSSTGPNRWPQSGTVGTTVTATLGALPTTTSSISFAFNGTSTVAITMTSGGRTTQCTVDLSHQTTAVCTA
jgi:hypothetical protein